MNSREPMAAFRAVTGVLLAIMNSDTDFDDINTLIADLDADQLRAAIRILAVSWREAASLAFGREDMQEALQKDALAQAVMDDDDPGASAGGDHDG
jgi:hypothetical protein